jgi:hypothetical protein
MVDHGHKNDSVEVGKVNVGVSLTDMLVDEEVVVVGKKDSVPSTALEDPSPIQNKTHTKDGVPLTASEKQYPDIMLVIQEAMKAFYEEDEIVGKETLLAEAGEHKTASDNQTAERFVVQHETKANDGVPLTEMLIGDEDIIVGKETQLATEIQSAEMAVVEHETTPANEYTPEAYQKEQSAVVATPFVEKPEEITTDIFKKRERAPELEDDELEDDWTKKKRRHTLSKADDSMNMDDMMDATHISTHNNKGCAVM